MNSLLDYVKKVNESVKADDTKFNIDTIYSKKKEATKTPISVRSDSASSMTTAMKKMFKRMGLKNTVEVTKNSEFVNGTYYHYYHFFVDGSEVQTHRTHGMSGNIGKFYFFSCVNDCIIHAIVKNENLTGKDKQAVEDIFDIYNDTAPDWKSSGYKLSK